MNVIVIFYCQIWEKPFRMMCVIDLIVRLKKITPIIESGVNDFFLKYIVPEDSVLWICQAVFTGNKDIAPGLPNISDYYSGKKRKAIG